MSDASKAVFLSYASQDAEAAKRICDAMRSGGVEVWFDADGGLEHGDEWDAKIRKQIKECVLFIPLISANTQSRLEGYFRIEWDLAAERARGIASGVPFILPIVIDDTREPDAFVPDRFRAVQWTKLPGGEVPPEVLQRFLKLWSHRIGVVSHESAVGASLSSRQSLAEVDDDARGRRQAAPLKGKTRTWLFPTIVVMLAIAGISIWAPWKSDTQRSAGPPTSAAPVSEARKLANRAMELLEDPNFTRETSWLADELCQRALSLDAGDAEVWAVASLVSQNLYRNTYDRSADRWEKACSQAARASQLDPQSVRGALAVALCLERSGNDGEQLRILRELHRRAPDDQVVIFHLVQAEGLQGNHAAVHNLLQELRALPRTGVLPLTLWFAELRLRSTGRFAEAEAILDEMLSGPEVLRGAYYEKLNLLMGSNRDLAEAGAFIEQIPDRFQQEPAFGSAIAHYWLWRAEPEKALRALARVPQDYFEEYAALEPKGYLTGWAHAMAGRAVAAQAEWRSALSLVEERLRTDGRNFSLLEQHALLLALTGQGEAAREAWQLRAELGGGAQNLGITAFIVEALVYLALNEPESALTALERLVAAPLSAGAWARVMPHLRHHPAYAPIQEHPRMQRILAEGATVLRKFTEAQTAAPTAVVPAPVDDKSVAVLAFANLSDDKDNEYFSDGISEELLNVLAKVPGLKVTARTSAFFFKGKQVPIADIGQQLGVAYVVEGSVRKAGDRVRISAQLIKASDGFNVWSDSYDRDLKDIFAVQDEIAGRIARELSSRLGVATGAVSGTGGTKSVEAYEAFLKGRAAWSQRTYSSNQEAVRYFQQAIALDPGYALAHGALAEGYVTLSINGVEPADKVFPLAKASAERALELDPNIVQAYTALAEYYFHYARDYEESDREIERALAVDPNYAVAYSRYSGHLICRNRLEEALAMDERSIALNPLGPEATNSWTLVSMKRYDQALESARRESAPDRFPMSGRQTVGLIQFLTGHGEEAVKTLEGVVRDFPEETDPLTYLGWVYGQVGRTTKARAILQRMMAMSESRYVSPLEMAKVAAGMDDREQAFAQLERAFERREPELPTIGASRFFDPIRDYPRFREMLKRLNLDAYFP